MLEILKSACVIIAELALGGKMRFEDEAAAGEVCQQRESTLGGQLSGKHHRERLKTKQVSYPKFYFKAPVVFMVKYLREVDSYSAGQKTHAFMEPECSSPCLQKPAIRHYFEPI